MNVAMGYKDGESLCQDLFTTEEIEFARENGVALDRRFSATAMEKYLANICTGCDRIQGNWFLYMDPFHDRFNLFRTERQEYGPCDKCATRYCMTHGEYLDYRGNRSVPLLPGGSRKGHVSQQPRPGVLLPGPVPAGRVLLHQP